MGRKKKEASLILTELELLIMNWIWTLGGATAKSVQEVVSKDKSMAYTTVSTILRLLEKKGYLKADKEGRGHKYCPTLSREEYQARTLTDVVSRVFLDSPLTLVKQMVQGDRLSEGELNELKHLLAKELK